MSERPELRLVRERLESVLSPTVAGATLFEALGAGPPPTSALETLALVAGPLLASLTTRLGAEEAHLLTDEITLALTHALANEAPGGRPRGDTTLEIPLSGAGKLVVIVLSGSDAMAAQLEGAIGQDRVSAVGVRTAMGLRRALDAVAPGVVIVDAATFPNIEPAEVAAALAQLPRAVLRAIWGSDLPYGAVTMTECAQRGVTATRLDRREGIAPLIDLLRART